MYIYKNRLSPHPPYRPLNVEKYTTDAFEGERERERDERDRDKVICVLSWIEIEIDKKIASDKALYMDELKEKEIEIYIEKAINK